MNIFIKLILGVLVFFTRVSLAGVDVETTSGASYEDASVKEIQNGFVTLSHSKGIARIALIELSEATRNNLAISPTPELAKWDFDIHVANLKSSLEALDTSYEHHLSILELESKDNGLLDQLLAVREEKSNFRNGTKSENIQFEKLLNLRTIYDQNREERMNKILADSKPVIERYRDQLNRFQLTLTKDDKIDEAVEIKKEEESITSFLNDPEKILSFLKLKPGPTVASQSPEEKSPTTSTTTPLINSGAPDDALPFGEGHYKIFFDQMSWTEAKRKCDLLGGRLAVVHDQKTSSFIKDIAMNRPLWLGASDAKEEGIWVWVDDSKMDFDNWGPVVRPTLRELNII